MRTPHIPSQEGIQKGNEIKSVETKLTKAFSFSSQISYHELSAIPVRDINLLEQLHANIETLSDLQARMNFMMREIRYMMKV